MSSIHHFPHQNLSDSFDHDPLQFQGRVLHGHGDQIEQQLPIKDYSIQVVNGLYGKSQSPIPSPDEYPCHFDDIYSDQDLLEPVSESNFETQQNPTQPTPQVKSQTRTTSSSTENQCYLEPQDSQSTTLTDEANNGLTKISDEQQNKKFSIDRLIRQVLITQMNKTKPNKSKGLTLNDTSSCNVQLIASLISDRQGINPYIIQENQIIYEPIKARFPMAVYWVEILIKKKTNLLDIMKELQPFQELIKMVYLEKQLLAWKRDIKKLTDELEARQKLREQETIKKYGHIVKMTREEEENIDSQIDKHVALFEQYNQKCLDPKGLAKNCNRYIADTFGLIIVQRIYAAFIKEQGLSKKETKFKESYGEIYKKIENIKRSKNKIISKGFQMQQLKRILCMNEIPEAYWREILNQAEIYQLINKSKIREKPFLKMFYYCFVPRLTEIRRRRQTSRHAWLYNGRKERAGNEWRQMRQRECSLQTALAYEQAWLQGQTVAEMEKLNVQMDHLGLEEMESDRDIDEQM